MITLTYGIPISDADFRKIALWLIPEYAKLPAKSLEFLENEISSILAAKNSLVITKDESGQYYLHNLFTLNMHPFVDYKYKAIETVLGRQLHPSPLVLSADTLID